MRPSGLAGTSGRFSGATVFRKASPDSYSLSWPRFNERGALWGFYGGLITFFPVNNPGIVAIPVAFFLG